MAVPCPLGLAVGDGGGPLLCCVRLCGWVFPLLRPGVGQQQVCVCVAVPLRVPVPTPLGCQLLPPLWRTAAAGCGTSALLRPRGAQARSALCVGPRCRHPKPRAWIPQPGTGSERTLRLDQPCCTSRADLSASRRPQRPASARSHQRLLPMPAFAPSPSLPQPAGLAVQLGPSAAAVASRPCGPGRIWVTPPLAVCGTRQPAAATGRSWADRLGLLRDGPRRHLCRMSCTCWLRTLSSAAGAAESDAVPRSGANLKPGANRGPTGRPGSGAGLGRLLSRQESSVLPRGTCGLPSSACRVGGGASRLAGTLCRQHRWRACPKP